MMTDMQLIETANRARGRAYAPYSGFSVGAALLAEDGTVYTGCNIENASFSATCCAERTAFACAVADGKRSFLKIAVMGSRAGKDPDRFFMPCGICRQVMREFCKDDFVILVSDGKEICSRTLAELLPGSFSGEALEDRT